MIIAGYALWQALKKKWKEKQWNTCRKWYFMYSTAAVKTFLFILPNKGTKIFEGYVCRYKISSYGYLIIQTYKTKNLSMHAYTHTHTHTHIYIYIYIYI